MAYSWETASPTSFRNWSKDLWTTFGFWRGGPTTSLEYKRYGDNEEAGGVTTNLGYYGQEDNGETEGESERRCNGHGILFSWALCMELSTGFATLRSSRWLLLHLLPRKVRSWCLIMGSFDLCTTTGFCVADVKMIPLFPTDMKKRNAGSIFWGLGVGEAGRGEKRACPVVCTCIATVLGWAVFSLFLPLIRDYSYVFSRKSKTVFKQPEWVGFIFEGGWGGKIVTL